MRKIDQFLSEITKLYENRYVSFSDLEDFKNSHEFPTDLNSLRRQKLNSLLCFDLKIYQKLTRLDDFLNHREKLNQKFIERVKKQPLQIEDVKLDQQQAAAVVASEDAELILAPAGSGKTATLLSKVNYLIEHDQIEPKNILVIAFTNKVVAELKDRLNNDDVEIRTFHSFGNKIIKDNYRDYRLIDEETSTKLIQKILAKLQTSNNQYSKNYQAFLSGEDADHLFMQANPITPEAFEELIISAISLQKSERLTLKELASRINKIKDEAKKREAEKLYELYAPIYRAYEKYLQVKKLYDFSDMLNLSADFIRGLPENSFDYEYILVDEAQDLSESKSELLRVTLEKCRKVKLFAVGDDWQSIYRFAGSNLKVMDDFEKIFGRKTYRGMLELTYRFGQPTAKISNRFITKNRFQSKKKVTPVIKKFTPIEYELYDTKQIILKNRKYFQNLNLNLNINSKISSKSFQDSDFSSVNLELFPIDYFSVDKKLNELYEKYGEKLKDKNLQIISRFNRDIFRLVDQKTHQFANAKYDSRTATLTWLVKNQKFKLSFCTIHKAKGITRDIVFVINMNDGNMPASRDGNPMLETMLTEMDNYPFAEERRLFYVAITRAKERTILVADKNRISDFVLEINPKLKQQLTD